MKIKDMIESAQILTDSGLGDTFLEADHDVIFGPHPSEVEEKVSEKDLKRLEELGWHMSSEYDCLACFV